MDLTVESFREFFYEIKMSVFSVRRLLRFKELGRKCKLKVFIFLLNVGI